MPAADTLDKELMIKRHLPFLFLLSLTFTGCNALRPWSPAGVAGSGPWCAATQRATLYKKTVHHAFSPTGELTLYKWKTPLGASIGTPDDTIQNAKKFLGQTHQASTWPNTNLRVGPEVGPRVHAPFEFYLISIAPTVVLIVPSVTKEHQTWVDWSVDQPESGHESPRPSRIIQNQIHLSGPIKWAHAPWWFSPDLNAPPIACARLW